MQLKFPFEVVGNDKIPLIDIRITNKENKKATNYRAMLDSGAYANVFHSDIAEVLSINLASITGFALLGRQGFFDQFDEVRFNYKNNKFYLQK